MEAVSATFLSADLDPGLRFSPGEYPRDYQSICGPLQVLFVSAPVAEATLIAGNFEVDLTLSSNMPGGNLSVFLWRTSGSGACPDATASWFGRALMDLRHWESPGRSRDFPTDTPTRVHYASQPLAATLRRGERIVMAVGGGSSELEPDPRHPRLTVNGGSLKLPIVTPAPAPAAQPAPPMRKRTRPGCVRSRRLTIHLRRDLARARVTAAGRRARVRRRGGRLLATLDLRRTSKRTVRVRSKA